MLDQGAISVQYAYSIFSSLLLLHLLPPNGRIATVLVHDVLLYDLLLRRTVVLIECQFDS